MGMIVIALGGGSIASSQAASITIPDGDSAGTYANFGGFDWSAGGKATVFDWWTDQDTVSAGDTRDITLDFWTIAGSVSDPFQNNLTGPTRGILDGDYEFTFSTQLTERATCLEAVGGACIQSEFELLAGSWQIYYDPNPNADQLAGTGFQDGTLILEGDFDLGFAGVFTAIADATGFVGGTGSNTLQGTVTYTNSDFFTPDLVGTTVGTELKFGNDRTDGGVLVTGTPFNSPVTCSVEDGTICLQADANQSFRAAEVPEPATVALLGFGLVGLVALRRRMS
ncbi:hypothetical protein M911_13010 [Ectothiorhodospira haloalkaliphila]|uniref:Ice-binding protein C-terminal domain-containing protein n=2 Tax=Ectothiorhodospira haloalkaliphila TaxID=421628 RepID=W8LAB3_9GAMM|nr:hypothetical protein M911_13010 [Ectothiorhodospira haloalkaliphila]